MFLTNNPKKKTFSTMWALSTSSKVKVFQDRTNNNSSLGLRLWRIDPQVISSPYFLFVQVSRRFSPIYIPTLLYFIFNFQNLLRFLEPIVNECCIFSSLWKMSFKCFLLFLHCFCFLQAPFSVQLFSSLFSWYLVLDGPFVYSSRRLRSWLYVLCIWIGTVMWYIFL